MNKIIEGAKEALAVARGEQPAARIFYNGHYYVPEAEIERLRERCEAYKGQVEGGAIVIDGLRAALKTADIAVAKYCAHQVGYQDAYVAFKEARAEIKTVLAHQQTATEK